MKNKVVLFAIAMHVLPLILSVTRGMNLMAIGLLFLLLLIPPKIKVLDGLIMLIALILAVPGAYLSWYALLSLL